MSYVLLLEKALLRDFEFFVAVEFFSALEGPTLAESSETVAATILEDSDPEISAEAELEVLAWLNSISKNFSWRPIILFASLYACVHVNEPFSVQSL